MPPEITAAVYQRAYPAGAIDKTAKASIANWPFATNAKRTGSGAIFVDSVLSILAVPIDED